MASPATTGRPRLTSHVRLSYDASRDRHVLLRPETVAVLNATSADILRLCDGRRSVGEIAAELRRRYDRVVDDDVRAFLALMVAKRCVEISDG